uniref:Uncharacterized protein n=1 Tax=Arundo donax TaxID=35708 RepID=A0A0A9TJ95_ARUDO
MRFRPKPSDKGSIQVYRKYLTF